MSVRMQKVVVAAGVAGLVLAAGSAFGQSVNVDFNRASGPGTGAPASSFTAASGQGGVWNAVAPSSASGGTMAAVSEADGSGTMFLRHYASNGPDSANYGSGEFAKLMADYAFGFTQNGKVEVEFTGLDEGYYDVYVYTGLPQAEAFYEQFGQQQPHRAYIGVYVDGTSLAGTAQTAGYTAAPAFVQGVNYAKFSAGVPEAGNLKIVVSADLAYSLAKVAVNGIQLVKTDIDHLCVTPSGAGDRSGRGWANAMSSIQAAMDLAGQSNGLVDEVWVAAGTYKPALSDRTKSFQLRDGVLLRGGFTGNETAPDQRDSQHFTILSGNVGNVFTDGDNSYTVVRADNVPWARMEGVTIRDGRAFGPQAEGHNTAGGLYALVGQLDLENCTFENNRGVFGGAAALWEMPEFGWGTIEVKGCRFYDNHTTGDGGAINYWGFAGFWDVTDLRVESCAFERNTAEGLGGAVYGDGHTFQLVNSLMNGNSANDGGAVWFAGSGIWLLGSTVTSNHAELRTGGVAAGYIWDAAIGYNVYGSILWNNTSDGAASTATRQLRQIYGADAQNGIILNRSCVQGDISIFQTEQASNVWPRFVNLLGHDGVAGTLDDDLHLADDSPLIDAGLDINRDLDLDGLPRAVDRVNVEDTGDGLTWNPLRYVDMGCFENQNTGFCVADFNGDGVLDFFDVQGFLNAFATQDPSADLTGDAVWNFFDVQAFLAAFSAGCP